MGDNITKFGIGMLFAGFVAAMIGLIFVVVGFAIDEVF